MNSCVYDRLQRAEKNKRVGKQIAWELGFVVHTRLAAFVSLNLPRRESIGQSLPLVLF